jgi:glyceraldehyde-3-phosphate dehydrogenase (NADP+)
METYPIYVAGEFVTTDNELEVSNPYDGKVFAKTYQAGEAEFEAATEAAVAAQDVMRNLPTYKRFEILHYISHRLKEDRERLAKVLAMESGKPMVYALGEIDRSTQTFMVAAEEAKRIPGEEFMRLDWTKPGEGKVGIVKQFPVGPVAGIAPFNFPMNLAVHKLAPAIAAGCPIVLKPASSTPLSTLELAKIIDETDLPKGAVSILPMDRTNGNRLVTDDRYKLLSFTGSPVVGWKMKEQAGEKKVVLELGGNAGVIVSESADLDQVMPGSTMGAFAYAGQVCIHAQRFFVHRSHYDEFLQRLKVNAEKLKCGCPTKADTEFSSMIDQKNADRVEAWVQEALDDGAKLISGGKKDGTLYAPTILTNVPREAKVNAEEVFGPVVVVQPFDEFYEAINLANDGQFGLQAGVYTESTTELQQAFNDLEVGGVIHNNVPTFRVDHMPYGGVKQSGLGREGVKYAMLDMLEPRILVQTG